MNYSLNWWMWSWSRSRPAAFLRFFVDTDEGVSVDELENFHRRILPLVERVDYDYMEVSSPGADRPLKT